MLIEQDGIHTVKYFCLEIFASGSEEKNYLHVTIDLNLLFVTNEIVSQISRKR